MKNGFVLMIASGLCFLVVNFLVKVLGGNNPVAEHFDFQSYGAHELVFFRSLVSFLMSAYAIKKAKLPFWGNNKKWLLIRGFAGVFALTIFFFTLQELPLAVAAIVQYLSPIFTVILAWLFLKERMANFQWLFILLAFSGVLMLAFGKDDTRVEEFSLFWIGMGIVAAFGSAVAYFAIVKLKPTDTPMHIVLYFPMLALPITGVWCLFDFVMPQGIEWIVLLLIGIFTQMAQIAMTKAFHTESASAIVPFQYLGAIYAFILGILVFDEHLPPLLYLALTAIFVGVIGNAILRSKLKRIA